MKTTPHLLNLKALTLPLRDIFRGIQQLQLVPDSVTKTALETLPQPIRAALREISGIDANESDLDHPDHTPLIASAAQALHKGSGSSTDVAKASAIALRHLLDANSQRPCLVSETALSRCWRRAEGTANAAARFAIEIERHEPYRDIVGMPYEQNDTTTAKREYITLALCIWLLAERANDDLKETDLLDIASIIASELELDVLGSPDVLQESLLSAAVRI